MHVPTPTLEDAKEFDLLVWIGDEGEVLTKSYSLMGEVILRSMINDYTSGDVLEILVHPDEFNKDLPPTARVGYVDPRTARIRKMGKRPIH